MAGIALHGMVLKTTVRKNISSDNRNESGFLWANGIDVSAESVDNVFDSNVVDNNGGGGIVLHGPASVNVLTNLRPPLLDLVSPNRAPYVEGTDYRVMAGSSSGDVTARLVAIDIALGPTATTSSNPNPANTSTSGCDTADYDAAGFKTGGRRTDPARRLLLRT